MEVLVVGNPFDEQDEEGQDDDARQDGNVDAMRQFRHKEIDQFTRLKVFR